MIRYALPCLISVLLNEHGLAQQVIATTGGTAVLGDLHLQQTLGETMTAPFSSNGLHLTQGFHQPLPVRVAINMRAFLQGPYETTTGRMSDGLRSAGLVPLNEPYSALGLVPVGAGVPNTSSLVLATTGDNAIIDWVYVELRDAGDPSTVKAAHAALLQADGDVVDVDGTSPVAFAVPQAPYFVALRHRVHLACMTAGTFALSGTPTAIDLTSSTTATFGTEAQGSVNGVMVLWCGDVNGDGALKYTGSANDRDPMLVAIGGTVPTNVTTGYRAEDVNLDGQVKYTGTNNDRDPILVNIGGTEPTHVRNVQLP